MIEKHISDIEDMKNLASYIANKTNRGDTILLKGDLGAGKTTFARFLINYLCENQENVISPSFMIEQSYHSKYKGDIVHLDLYRIKHEEELEEISLSESLYDKIVIIEWPEIAVNYIPEDFLLIDISVQGTARIIKLYPEGSWEKRLNDQ